MALEDGTASVVDFDDASVVFNGEFGEDVDNDDGDAALSLTCGSFNSSILDEDVECAGIVPTPF